MDIGTCDGADVKDNAGGKKTMPVGKMMLTEKKWQVDEMTPTDRSTPVEKTAPEGKKALRERRRRRLE